MLVIGEDEVAAGKARLRDRATREEREVVLEVGGLVEALQTPVQAPVQSSTVLS